MFDKIYSTYMLTLTKGDAKGQVAAGDSSPPFAPGGSEANDARAATT